MLKYGGRKLISQWPWHIKPKLSACLDTTEEEWENGAHALIKSESIHHAD